MEEHSHCNKNFKFRFGFFEKPLSHLCHKHSLIVAAHPWPFIIVPILISGAFGVGYFMRQQQPDVLRMHIPIDGQCWQEKAIVETLFPNLDEYYTPMRTLSAFNGETDLIVVAKDGGNILRPEYRKAVIDMNNFVRFNISVTVDGLHYTYENICMHFLQFCHTNPQIYIVDLLMSNPKSDANTNLTYPTARYGNRRFYLANTLGDVKVEPLSKQIISAKGWLLIYQLRWGAEEKISKAWQLQYQRTMLNYKSAHLEISVFHSQTLDLEVARNGENILPKMVLCIVMLITFANLCSLSVLWDHNTPYVDWTRSKPFVGTAGLIGAIMGVVTSIGLLAYCGVQYDAVVDAMPFVVLGVRLDNTFLMISAVHHTKQTLPAHERVGEAMSEAAVSITITVLTDVLSFAVGIFTDFRAVQLFSIYIVLAMTITYIYQLTFLLGVIVLCVRAEENNLHSVAVCRQTVEPQDNPLPPSLWIRLFCFGSHVEKPKNPENTAGHSAVTRTISMRSEKNKVQYQEGTWISRIIRTYYAPWLMKTKIRIVVGFVYLGYLAISIYGCTIVREGLEPSRLLPDDSYAKIYSRQLEQYFWKEGPQAHITFSNAGDLTDKSNRERIYKIIDRFADSDHGMGRDGVDFWLYEFANFLKTYNHQALETLNREQFFMTVKYFLSLQENAQYRNDVHWTNNTYDGMPNITSFRALVGMRELNTALKQIDTVNLFRAIAEEFPYHKVTTFQLTWMFADQYQEVLPNTMQEIYGGIAFMILIAVFLIPSVMSTVWVVLAILSIDAGTIGFMTFWDINLDSISMICIIMSIGFSVDFTAHIAYCFVVIEGKSPVDKTHKALGTLAWPILQGGISTTMGVVALAGGGSYIQVAFFKTVFIVISLGLLHALVFLPVVLSVFSCKLSTKPLKKLCCFGRSSTNKVNDIEIAVINRNLRNAAYHDDNASSDSTIPEDPKI